MPSPLAWIQSLAGEARRRRVWTSIVAYVALSLVLIQLGDAVFKALLLPEWAVRLLTVLLILGLPIVVMLAWAFDIGPDGVTRTGSSERPGAVIAAGAPARAPAMRIAGATGGQAAPGRGGPAGTMVSALALERVVPDPARVRETALAHARHELRTPINAIIGYSEMLLEDSREGGVATAVPDLERIRSAGRDLLARVDRILDPARLTAEPAVDFEAFGAQIRADLRDPTTAVIGYAEMLIDDGEHSMRADLERILGAARRLLDMSTDLVRLATQPATVASTARLSATSTIAAGVLAQIAPVGVNTHADGRQGTLLVVDDNPLNRDLLSRQLARKGYVVATCENGREALERLERERFDVVLLDILMPEVDGVETLRRLKSDARHVDLPVIMISSLNEMDGAIRCLEMGAADYLTKPFHPTLLDARIGTVLEARRMREREGHYLRQLEEEQGALQRVVVASCPPVAAERIRRGETSWVESHHEVALLWMDLGRNLRAADAAEHAALMTSRFDASERVAGRHGFGTVFRAGSAIVIAGGVSAPRADAARDLAACALDIAAALGPVGGEPAMGLHVGAGYGGIIGADRLSFQLWGEAFDVARALEAVSPAGAICMSPAMHAQVRDAFPAASLGVVDVGAGTQMRAYRLLGSNGG